MAFFKTTSTGIRQNSFNKITRKAITKEKGQKGFNTLKA